MGFENLDNEILDLETLVSNNEYGHLIVLKSDLLDIKLELLMLLDEFETLKSNILDFNNLTKVIIETTSIRIDLDNVNTNLDVVKMALQFKEKKTMEFLDTGTYYKN